MLALAAPSAAAAAFSDNFDGTGTIATAGSSGSAMISVLNTCSGAMSPDCDRSPMTSNWKISCGTPALTKAARAGVAAPATLSIVVARCARLRRACDHDEGPVYPGGLTPSTQKSSPSFEPGMQSYTDKSVTPDSSSTSSHNNELPVYFRAGLFRMT